MQEWFEAYVDGFNLVYSVTPGTFMDFIDGVVPVLQARGLVRGNMRQPAAQRFSPARLSARVILPQPTATAKTRKSEEFMKALLDDGLHSAVG